MNQNKHSFLGRLSAFVFGAIFLSVLVLLALTFFVPKGKMRKAEYTLDYPRQRVWQAIYQPTYYLSSKKEISKYKVYDTIMPRWTEYYTSQDSIENRTATVIPMHKLTYGILNRKHQQINAFSFRVDAIDAKHTKLTIYEWSRYFNVWGSIYFQLLRPNTVLDYEYVKIHNTLTYIDSIGQIQQ